MSTTERRELFSGRELDEVLEQRRAALRQEIEGSDPDTTDLGATVRKYSIQEIRLADKEVGTTHARKEVDAARFPNTLANWKGESCVVWGLEVTYHVLFKGSAFLLECKSQVRSGGPIFAKLSADELQFALECLDSDGIAATAQRFEDHLWAVKEILRHINGKVREFNRSLPTEVESFRSDRRRVQRELSMLGYAPRSPVSEGNGTNTRQDCQPVQSGRAGREGQETNYQIALSFASEDRECAREIADQLRRQGIGVFHYEDQQAALWGTDLAEQLGVVFGGGSDFVMMLISQHYVRKIWTTHERRHAQAHALSTKSEYILPVRLDDTPVPGMPSTVAYQDLREISVQRLVELTGQKLQARRSRES